MKLPLVSTSLLRVQPRLGRTVQWHGGDVSGFVAHMMRFPAEKLFVAILSYAWSDADRGQARAMGNELAALALGEHYELPRKRQRIRLDPAFELIPESDREFFASRPEYFLTFTLDDAGNATSALIRNEGEESRWSRVP